jgi:hypothetical protein
MRSVALVVLLLALLFGSSEAAAKKYNRVAIAQINNDIPQTACFRQCVRIIMDLIEAEQAKIVTRTQLNEIALGAANLYFHYLVIEEENNLAADANDGNEAVLLQINRKRYAFYFSGPKDHCNAFLEPGKSRVDPQKQKK